MAIGVTKVGETNWDVVLDSQNLELSRIESFIIDSSATDPTDTTRSILDPGTILGYYYSGGWKNKLVEWGDNFSTNSDVVAMTAKGDYVALTEDDIVPLTEAHANASRGQYWIGYKEGNVETIDATPDSASMYYVNDANGWRGVLPVGILLNAVNLNDGDGSVVDREAHVLVQGAIESLDELIYPTASSNPEGSTWSNINDADIKNAVRHLLMDRLDIKIKGEDHVDLGGVV